MQILLVMPDPLLRRVTRRFLTQARYQVSELADATAAPTIIAQQQMGLLITTWPIPGVDGIDLLRRVRAAPVAGATYIVLIVERDDQELLIEGMQAGADDYLISPVKLKELRRRVILGGRIMRLEHQLSQTQQELAALLSIDELTSLPNRPELLNQAAAALARAEQHGRTVSFVFCTIDGFRKLNGQHGYEVGDTIVRTASMALVRALRQYDCVGRWSSSEFLIILPDTHLQAAIIVAERIRERLSKLELCGPDGDSIPLRASLGVTSTSLGLTRALPDLIQQADLALQQASDQGGDTVCAFARP